MPQSTAEMVILALLICASAGLFWVRFRKVPAVLRAARPNREFHLRPLGPRIRQFLWEVMLQGKVIRERPAAGLAHAFVFWGFCAFAAITVNHLAEGFGARLIPADSPAGLAYMWFVAVFAFAVAVAIAGLFVRRFFVRPRWLGPVSPESGVIAGLIFLLMVTYLLRMPGLGFPEESTAGRSARSGRIGALQGNTVRSGDCRDNPHS